LRCRLVITREETANVPIQINAAVPSQLTSLTTSRTSEINDTSAEAIYVRASDVDSETRLVFASIAGASLF